MTSDEFRSEMRNRRRRGCRGCFTGCLSIVGILMLAGLGYAVMLFVLAPYTYFYGGYFHIFPGWQGEGKIHVPDAGGDYDLYLHIDPTIPGYRKEDIQGTAFLCTPKGERFALTILGDLPRSRPRNTLGIPLHISAHKLQVSQITGVDYRPNLELYGAFADHKLVLEDRGSIPTAFRADGSLFPKNSSRPSSKQVTKFTLEEASPWMVRRPACPAQ